MPVDLLRDGLVSPRGQGGRPVPDAFQEWLEEQVAQGKPLEAPPDPVRPSGPCRLCNERPGSAVCVQCQCTVCAAHHWVMFGLCRGCLTEEELRAARHAHRRPKLDLGIKWVED